MRQRFLPVGMALLLASPLLAQPPARKGADIQSQPFKAQSSSSISYTGGKEGDQTVEITNVAYEVTGDSVPGRPRGSRLVLRTSTHSKWTVGDKGTDSTVTVETWPLGVDLKQKPLYALTLPGIGARTLDLGILLVDRGDGGDASWWSVYKLGTGQHLFDKIATMGGF